jgi:protein SCO1/2/putative membrane protein
MWESLASNLPHLTAALNLMATVLLVLGLINIRRGLVRRHKTMMLSALGVSAVFLLVYLLHKLSLYMATGEWNNKFPTDPEVASTAARYTYYGILITHLMLAIIVPVLAVRAVFLAMKGRIAEHKRLVRFAYPAWIYVSVTGVLVYLMLYQIYG